MKPRLALYGMGLLCPLLLSAAPPVVVEPDSVECHFALPPPTGEEGEKAEKAAAPFILRLHVSPDKASRLSLHRTNDLPPVPLVGKDGRGNILIGRFREWEECFDARRDCHIMVYEFSSLPQGGSLTVDTELSLPVMGKDIRHRPVALPAEGKENGLITAGGYNFRIIPIPPNEESEHAGERLLTIEYEYSPEISLLELTDARGVPLVHKLVDGNRDDEKKLIRDTYLLKTKGARIFLTLSTYPTFRLLRVPASFRLSLHDAEALGKPKKEACTPGKTW